MKKVLSLVLSLVMAVTSLTMATGVFAEEAKIADVEFSVYDGGVFTMTPQVISVSADIDNAYAEAIGYNDNDSEVTVFDAIVAAHIWMFGDDFMTYAPMIYSNGMLKQSFGETTTALTYRINGAVDDGTGNYYNLDSALKDGDSVEYMFYQDSSFYGDKYTRFDKRNVDLYAGESLTLALTVETYDTSTWEAIILPAAGMDIIVDGVNYGKTDSEGKITLPFKAVGKFGVTAQGQYSDDYDDYEIFAPYCTVNVTNEVVDYVNKQEAAAAKYVYFPQESFSIEGSYDFVTLIRSGYDVSEYADSYVLSLKNNLDANGGKLITSASGEAKEDIGLYGAVIIVLKELGYDTTDFYGYNLEKTLNDADIDAASTHQYHYKYAIEAASPEKAKAIINDLITKYYTLGSGMDNWGYSCDNTCHFLISIAPYAGDFETYVDDAKTLIRSYLRETGAYSDDMWVTEPNADSTALSLAAFASIGEAEEAFEYYKLLVANFESENTGIFLYGGEANSYATNDALFSLYYFKKAVYKRNINGHLFKLDSKTPATCKAAGREVYKCRFCNIEQVKDIQKLAHKVVVDKAVAPTFKKAGKTKGSHCSVCGAVIKKQKTLAKLGSPSVAKLVKGKGAFTASWKKVESIGGYQLQYSTKKNFKSKKTVKLSKKASKKKITGLKSKQTYYVRIRAYKKINGKMQYSTWSKAVKVKTK